MTDQATFRAGLLDAAVPVPDGLIDGADRPAGRRYAVYRNNVTVSLIDAMKTAFPLVRNLIGAQNFDTLVPLYVRAHPPTSPLMMFYGDEFPVFLRGFEPLAHIGYLGDAAALDLAMRRSYHAADSVPFNVNILQNLAPEALLTAQVTLAPATQTIASDWPLFDIWRFNNEDGAPKPQAVAQEVMITRPAFDPVPHLCPPGTVQWLNALRDGHDFGNATDVATQHTAAFDLGASLASALETQALSTITPKEKT